MKNILLFAIATLFCIGSASAQFLRHEIGVEGGPGLAFVYGNSYSNSNLKPFWGGTLGGYYQFNALRIFSLKTGLYYMNIGSQSPSQAYDQSGNPLNAGKVHMNTDYLTLPVLAKLSFGGPVKFFLDAGPYAAVLLHATQDYEGVYQGYSVDKTSQYKRYDMGVAFGLGMSIHVSRIAINIEERSNLGLLNTSSDVHTFISTLMVGIGYRFGKGKEKDKK